MSKPIPFVVIGTFVMSALVLLVAGILFFGSGKFFKTTHEYVLFFDQSVNGLSEDSLVKFRGVEVGSVERITLAGGENTDPQIAVFVELFHSSKLQEFELSYDFSKPELVRSLIARGLKAQLRSQNVLSGELYINLDMSPESPYDFILPSSAGLTEIPTEKSGLMEDFTANSTDINETVKSIQQILTKVDSKLDPITTESLKTMKEMRAMFSTVNHFLEPNSPFAHQAPKTLGELERAAKAVRLLAEYIERNPSSLIFGRGKVEVVDAQ